MENAPKMASKPSTKNDLNVMYDNALRHLLNQIVHSHSSGELLHVTQATLNLTNSMSSAKEFGII